MIEESRLYFADLIAGDRPARNIIDADYTFADERLARHYGVPGVVGPTFRRISLPENSPYGGILASVSAQGDSQWNCDFTSTARCVCHGTTARRSSIPATTIGSCGRARYSGATTIRELLKKHRDDASASCHQKIDPPDLRWKDSMSWDVGGRTTGSLGEGLSGSKAGRSGNEYVHFIGNKVDASGVTPEGDPFEDVVQFKKLLLKNEEVIAEI